MTTNQVFLIPTLQYLESRPISSGGRPTTIPLTLTVMKMHLALPRSVKMTWINIDRKAFPKVQSLLDSLVSLILHNTVLPGDLSLCLQPLITSWNRSVAAMSCVYRGKELTTSGSLVWALTSGEEKHFTPSTPLWCHRTPPLHFFSSTLSLFGLRTVCSWSPWTEEFSQPCPSSSLHRWEHTDTLSCFLPSFASGALTIVARNRMCPSGEEANYKLLAERATSNTLKSFSTLLLSSAKLLH